MGCGTVWRMEMSTGSSPFLPAQWKGKEADQELRAVGAGQVLGTALMAPAFQGLCTPSRRQWTQPSSEMCFLKVGQEPECQRIPQEGSWQLSGRYPCGTRFGISKPLTSLLPLPTLNASWGVDTIFSSPHLERMEGEWGRGPSWLGEPGRRRE